MPALGGDAPFGSSIQGVHIPKAPAYVKCPLCSWLHVAISPKECRQRVFRELISPFGHRFGRSLFAKYMACFRCGADSATFVPGRVEDAPAGVSLQPVVLERGEGLRWVP